MWDGPFYVPPDAEGEMIARLVVDLSAKLTAVNRRADALVGHVDPAAGQ